jgi:type II secretory pathway component PulF
MHRQQVFSAMLVRMVALGETTGRLDSALITCGDYYDVTIPPRIKKLFAMLEPALMLFIIGLVGAVALAIYLPILSLMNSIK